MHSEIVPIFSTPIVLTEIPDAPALSAALAEEYGDSHLLRVITKRIPPERLFPIVERYFSVVHAATGLLLPINSHFSKVVSLLLGTADYRGLHPMDPAVMREWCLLDTFDKLSPAFDQPQTLNDVRGWFTGLDVAAFDVRPGYNGLEIHVRR